MISLLDSDWLNLLYEEIKKMFVCW